MDHQQRAMLAQSQQSFFRRVLHVLSTRVFDSAAVATHSTLVHLTSYFYFFGGLSVVVAAWLPGWAPGANLPAIVCIGMVAVCTAAFIHAFGARMPRWFFELSVLAGTGLITLVIVFSGSAEAAASAGYIYLYVIVDSALFFGLRGMLIQYGAVLAASLWSLHYMGVAPGSLAVLEISIAVTMLAMAWIARAVDVHESDQLTKLPNRRVFENLLGQALVANEARHEALSLVLFDLDHFQSINRIRGSHGADELLKRIANLWTEATPAAAKICRLGGDKFALLLPRFETAGAVLIADEFRSRLPAGVTASAGVSTWQSGDTPSTLIGRAEGAALEAKTYGRDTTMVFGDPERQARSIQAALHKREFTLEFQPIFRLSDRKIVSYEALIRWRHPRRGMVSPAHFIPIAERTGAIHALGQWVLDEVTRTIAANNDNRQLVSVAVNASMLELRAPGYADSVRRAVHRHSILPEQLTIEVTEAVFDGDNPGVLNTISALKEIGVKVAIDDFGAGYSSLRWLDRFPADILKIDKSFVDTITAPDQELKVLSNIVSLGRDLELTVLAEGVENEIQATALQRLGVERVQGYLLGRPMPLDDGKLPRNSS